MTSIALPPATIKAWQKFIVNELNMIQNPTDVMCAMTKTQARYKVSLPEIVSFVKALGAKARQMHEANVKAEVTP